MDASRQWSSSSSIENNMVRIIFTVLKWIIHIPSDLNWTESERGKTVPPSVYSRDSARLQMGFILERHYAQKQRAITLITNQMSGEIMWGATLWYSILR